MGSMKGRVKGRMRVICNKDFFGSRLHSGIPLRLRRISGDVLSWSHTSKSRFHPHRQAENRFLFSGSTF